MANPHADIHALAVRRTATTNGPVLRPPRRLFSRVMLPATLLIGFAALLVWASWDLLIPGTPVTVTPVVARAGIVQASGVKLFKTAGWIEPRPNPIEVTALAEGVVEKILVLPGQHVQAGETVAKLISADAELSLQAAKEDLAERQTKVRSAQADLQEAQAMLRAAEATLEAQAKLKDKLYGELSYIQAEATRDTAKAKIEQAKARLEEATSRVRQGKIAVETAELRLSRMTVRAPVSGTVLNQIARPGRMVGGRSVAGGMHDSLITMYDPNRLQIRATVGVDKFQYVQPGQPVEIEADILPGRKLQGTVLYDVPEAELNLRIVHVKIGITQYTTQEFAPVYCLPVQTAVQNAVMSAAAEVLKETVGTQGKLRPETNADVYFFAPPSEIKETGGEVVRIYVPEKLLVKSEGETRVWIVDQAAGRALLRTVVLGNIRQGDLIEVTQGLQPSDKLISSGRELLNPGQRVRIQSEQ